MLKKFLLLITLLFILTTYGCRFINRSDTKNPFWHWGFNMIISKGLYQIHTAYAKDIDMDKEIIDFDEGNFFTTDHYEWCKYIILNYDELAPFR